MANLEETITAFVDGEPVEPDALKVALGDAAGRDYLVDVLALRGLVGDQAIAPATPATARLNTRWYSAVAALIVVGTAAGFFAGQRMTTSVSDQLTPPPMSTVQASPAPPALIAPSPTRVIHLQNGKDWNERSGGN